MTLRAERVRSMDRHPRACPRRASSAIWNSDRLPLALLLQARTPSVRHAKIVHLRSVSCRPDNSARAACRHRSSVGARVLEAGDGAGMPRPGRAALKRPSRLATAMGHEISDSPAEHFIPP